MYLEENIPLSKSYTGITITTQKLATRWFKTYNKVMAKTKPKGCSNIEIQCAPQPRHITQKLILTFSEVLFNILDGRNANDLVLVPRRHITYF